MSKYKYFSSLQLSYKCRKRSYNTAVLIMSASLSCSLELYEVLGKHYDKASVCTLRSEGSFASLQLSFGRIYSRALNVVRMDRPHMKDVEC